MNHSSHTRLRVLVIGAHPDEADMYSGGTSALYAQMGHAVKFLSLTNGDAGHFSMNRFALAARRFDEAQEAAKRLGVLEYEVLDTHDSELMPTLDMRHRVLRAIRDWQADVVISHHPDGGGHPDNRAAGQIVDEAMAFVTNAYALPGSPPLKVRPAHLYMIDYITMRVHRHDVVIDIQPTIEQKLLACDANASQFYEASARQYCELDQVPTSWENGRREFILQHWADTIYALPEMRSRLADFYGEEHAEKVEFAETFQFSHDSTIPDKEVIRSIFPMLP